MKLKSIVFLGAATAALLAVSACDNGPSAVTARNRSNETQASYESSDAPQGRSDRSSSYSRGDNGGGSRSSGSARNAGSRDDVSSDGWAGTRKYGAAESAAFHFQRDGADFGASSVKDYVAKAKAFVSHPPKGVERLERKNGDTLLYDRRSNVFAVVSRDGAPRSMFKPRDGADYWEQQKSGGNGRRRGGNSGDQAG